MAIAPMVESAPYSIRAKRDVLSTPRLLRFMAIALDIAAQPEVFHMRDGASREVFYEGPEAELAAGFKYATKGVGVPAAELYRLLEVKLYEGYGQPSSGLMDTIVRLQRRVSSNRVISSGMRQERPGSVRQRRTRPNPLPQRLGEIDQDVREEGRFTVTAEEVVLDEVATERLGRLVYALRLADTPTAQALHAQSEIIGEDVRRTRAGKALGELATIVSHDGQLIDFMSVGQEHADRSERFLGEVNHTHELPLELDLGYLGWVISIY